MKLFTARVVDGNGKKSVVTEESISIPLFKESLSNKGFFIIDVKEASIKKSLFINQGIKKKFVFDLTYNIFSLLDFGLDINEVFRILADIYKDGKEGDFIRSVISYLKKGENLSKAIKSSKGGEIFDAFFLTMVASGEQSGNLRDSFKLIYSYLKTSQKIKDKLISAIIYPIILIVISFFVLNLLIFFLTPIIKMIYSSTNIEPKLFIKVIFAISDFLVNHVMIYIISLFTIIFGLILFFRTKTSKIFLNYISQKIPIISKASKLNIKIRSSFSLEILLKGGLSLEEAILRLGDLEKNDMIRKEYIRGLNILKEGGGVRKSFESIKIFDSKDLNIIEISDSISRAPEGFEKIYNDAILSLETFLEKIFELLTPIIMIFIGAFIFFILYLVLIPILSTLEELGGMM